MSDKDEVAIVVSVRCANLPEAEASGTNVRYCKDCGEPVWAADKTVALEQRFKRLDYVCQVCTPPAQLREIAAQQQIGLMPGQREELQERIGTWQTTLLIASLGAQDL